MNRLLFIGSGSFAIPIARKILEIDNVQLVGIVSQPAKLAGRAKELTPTPLLQDPNIASLQIPIYTPIKLSLQTEQILAETKPDVIVVAAYGQIIPKSMLETPKYKALNLHGSLLPKLRGAVPVPMAIWQGYQKTGVTIQVMAAALDAGDIIDSVECEINETDTADSLMDKLSLLAASELYDVLPRWLNGEITPVPQDATQATFCYEADLSRDKVKLQYNQSVEEVDRIVRACDSWPGAWFQQIINKQLRRVKIFKVNSDQLLPKSTHQTIGDIRIIKQGKQLLLELQEGWLPVTELQVEGKNRNKSSEYLSMFTD